MGTPDQHDGPERTSDCKNSSLGVLFSLASASPTSWDFDDQLELSKRSMPQFKLCGNHLVNMLGLVCGNFGGQGMAAFLEESFDPFSYDVNSKRRKRATGLEEWGISLNRPSKRSGLADHCCAKACTLQQLRSFC